MRKKHHHVKSKFVALENNFLNTFFSGLYISANEFRAIGEKVGISMGMNSRELLIKELLNKSDANDTLQQVVALLNSLIQERIETYHAFSKDYPAAAAALAAMAHKAAATKSLLNKEAQRNPYE